MGCDLAAGDSNWYACFHYGDCAPVILGVYDETWAGYLECVSDHEVKECEVIDPDSTFHACYWSDINCTDLGEPEGWHGCFWNGLCDGVYPDTTEPAGFDTFEEWLACYLETGDCHDENGKWYNCYAYDICGDDGAWEDYLAC